MKTYTESQLLEGVAKNHSKIISYIYDSYFPVIEGFVVHNNGTTEHAQDVFQEGMIIVFRKLKHDELFLSCKFITYLYSVCRNIWIQERKKSFLQQEKLKQSPLLVEDSGEHDKDDDFELLKELISKHLSEMSPDCQKIIALTLNDCSVEEIRREMNYNTIHHAIDRKYRCKRSLINRVVTDPIFKRIRNELR